MSFLRQSSLQLMLGSQSDQQSHFFGLSFDGEDTFFNHCSSGSVDNHLSIKIYILCLDKWSYLVGTDSIHLP